MEIKINRGKEINKGKRIFSINEVLHSNTFKTNNLKTNIKFSLYTTGDLVFHFQDEKRSFNIVDIISTYVEDIYTEDIKVKFEKYKNEWLLETKHHSNPNRKHNNENYKKIIEMGKNAIPLILEDWETSDNHWFYALLKITNENPVKKENIGYFNEMKSDWINFLKKDYNETK